MNFKIVTEIETVGEKDIKGLRPELIVKETTVTKAYKRLSKDAAHLLDYILTLVVDTNLDYQKNERISSLTFKHSEYFEINKISQTEDSIRLLRKCLMELLKTTVFIETFDLYDSEPELDIISVGTSFIVDFGNKYDIGETTVSLRNELLPYMLRNINL